jgi:parallel beta-helix repeat protein
VLGNDGNGVAVVDASGNTVGGSAPRAGNTIAFNGGDGVVIDGGTGNAILHNTIFGNLGLGIDLLHGGNNNQAAPELASAVSGAGKRTSPGR